MAWKDCPCSLTIKHYCSLKEVYSFLQPFNEAIPLLEGDYVALDKVLVVLDLVCSHFEDNQKGYRNTALSRLAITTS